MGRTLCFVFLYNPFVISAIRVFFKDLLIKNTFAIISILLTQFYINLVLNNYFT